MPDHYYSEAPVSEHKPRSFTDTILGNTLTFHTDAGVFSRDGIDVGSRVLMETVAPVTGKVLDMGAGWGAVGISIAKANPSCFVTLAEINTRAIELIRVNMNENKVDNVETVHSDGYSSVTGMYDCILTNPPIRAGKQVIYKMFSDARAHLNPKGAMFIVIRKQQGAPSAVKYLSTIYESCTVINKEAGFWILKCTGPMPETEEKE